MQWPFEFGWNRLGRGRFFENNMGVRAAETERTHSRKAPTCTARPWAERRGDLYRYFVPDDIGALPGEMQVRRYSFILQRENNFNQRRYARSRFEVPEIGLDRAQQQRLPPPLSQDVAQSIHLNWVAQRGACSVCFNIPQFIPGDPGIGKRLTNHSFL